MRECAFLGEFISMEKMPNLFTASTSILLQRFFSTNAFCLQEHKKVQSGQPFFVSIDAFKRTMAARKKGMFEYFHFFDVVGYTVHCTVHQWPLIPLATENHNKNLYKKLDNSNKSWHKSSILGLDTRQTVRVPAENFSFKKIFKSRLLVKRSPLL